MKRGPIRFGACCTTEADILRELRDGPVLSFGSKRETDKLLQKLKREGKIKHVRKVDGGNGWQLV